MNKVELIGRLTKDPEIKYTNGDTQIAVCKFSLAVDRISKDKEGNKITDFINCKAIGNRAETIGKFVSKGDRFAITGSWQTGSYKKEDGSTIYTNECLVETMDFIETKKEKEEKELSNYDSYNESDFENDLPF